MDKLRHSPVVLALLCGVGATALLFVVWKQNLLPLDFGLSKPYAAPIGLAGRAFQYLLAVLLSVFVLRFTPSREHLLTRLGSRTLQIYFLNFYFVAVYEKLHPIPVDHVLLVPVLLIVSAVCCLLITLPICDRLFAWYLKTLQKLCMKS